MAIRQVTGDGHGWYCDVMKKKRGAGEWVSVAVAVANWRVRWTHEPICNIKKYVYTYPIHLSACT